MHRESRLHLPALKITGEIDKVRRAAGDMHLAVRGFHGEGSDAAGDFYQVSNQITLGVAEEDLLQDLGQRIVPRLIAYEREARDVLLRRNRGELEDRVHRALGLLRSARGLWIGLALTALAVGLFVIAWGLSLPMFREISMLGIPFLALAVIAGRLARNVGAAPKEPEPGQPSAA